MVMVLDRLEMQRVYWVSAPPKEWPSDFHRGEPIHGDYYSHEWLGSNHPSSDVNQTPPDMQWALASDKYNVLFMDVPVKGDIIGVSAKRVQSDVKLVELTAPWKKRPYDSWYVTVDYYQVCITSRVRYIDECGMEGVGTIQTCVIFIYSYTTKDKESSVPDLPPEDWPDHTPGESVDDPDLIDDPGTEEDQEPDPVPIGDGDSKYQNVTFQGWQWIDRNAWSKLSVECQAWIPLSFSTIHQRLEVIDETHIDGPLYHIWECYLKGYIITSTGEAPVGDFSWYANRRRVVYTLPNWCLAAQLEAYVYTFSFAVDVYHAEEVEAILKVPLSWSSEFWEI
jgi:hypothetical protein